MFGMDNLDLEAVNRQFLFDAQNYIGSGGSSSSSSELFLYDEDSSQSDCSTTYSYGSDQENSSGKCYYVQYKFSELTVSKSIVSTKNKL